MLNRIDEVICANKKAARGGLIKATTQESS